MTVITYRELQRISAVKLLEMLPVVVTLEGEGKFVVSTLTEVEKGSIIVSTLGVSDGKGTE